MPEEFREFELTVGDVLHIGGQAMIVIDIDGLNVSFRIDAQDENDNVLDLPNYNRPRSK